VFAVVTSEKPKISCRPFSTSKRFNCTIEGVESFNEINTTLSRTSFAPESIIVINFVGSSLQTLPDKFFSNLRLKNVRTFVAPSSNIDSIENLAFFEPKSWDLIDLSLNRIEKLTGRIFASAVIESLDLSHNSIETIEENIFQGAIITNIHLSHNKLKSISFANSFSNFGVLELNDNLFETLDKFDFEGNKDSTSVNYRKIPRPPKIFLHRNKFKKLDCLVFGKIGGLYVEGNLDLKEILLNDCQVSSMLDSSLEF
jgi:Leucine-rich repeat (LRR) protein